MRQFIKRSFVNIYFAGAVLALVGGLFYYFHNYVELTPQISADFFFSKDSKIYRDDASIYRKFKVGDSIIVTLPSGDITTPEYLRFVELLSDELATVDGITSVQSITHGPPDIKSAFQNPMWVRFLDTSSRKNSLIVCFIDNNKVRSIVAKVKRIVRKKTYRGNTIYVSGIPYIIEEIRRMLSHDMKQFVAGATLVSSIVLLIIFLSFFVTLGAMITALAAAALTLVIQQRVGVPVGILTANLGAIVYVLTTSHIVFLTSNWRHDRHEAKNIRLASTITNTLPASFWAALTTVFGFASLIFVEARPLQELGVGGTIGTLCAFALAYLVYPIFLRFSSIGLNKKKGKKPKFFLPFKSGVGIPLAILLVIGAGLMGWVGVRKVNTDPSLLTYFKQKQSIYQGIRAVDRFGGSNPMNFVISHRDGLKLKNKKTYQQMMDLQNDIEAHPSVGNVLSLPILMAESQTNWLARLLPWGSILTILSRDQYGNIARGFVTEDFDQALYMIRMRETGRTIERTRIINQLMAKPKKHGFKLDIVGGPYYMQSELAQKIKKSMKQGILALLLLFTLIIFLLSLSIPITFFAGLSIVATTLVFLGCIGWFEIPVDIISSPAVNIVLGMAVDGMIHIILAARRMSEAKGHRTDRDGWVMAIKSQGQGVLISSVVIAAGFSVFYLSNFPPSQRFGLEIVFGTLVAMVMTLLVLPHLALMIRKRKALAEQG